ncbi:long-chain-fatty-acid--CoA ligase [Sulfurimonas sp. HSL-1716]|uniref:long-chain-fatty-acid--CoA ligase n=1 Tax=Hydrocurvibacter sulfurireducens TaxID=3131937 RepID=UPI0031F885C8
MTLEYPYKNFYEMIAKNTAVMPNKRVVFIDDEKLTNRELLQKIDSFAEFLSMNGFKADERAALILPNSLEFLISVFAVCKLGGVVVPINNMLKRDEYEYILNDCEAKILITSTNFEKDTKELAATTPLQKTIWIDEAPSIDEKNVLYKEVRTDIKVTAADKELDDTAVIFYTSGTTGNPKGAMLSYKNIFSNLIGGSMLFDIRQKDRFIIYLPMFHAFTFSIMMLLPIYSRSSVVIVRKLLPFSNIIKQTLLKRVSIFLGVPDIYNALIRAKLPWYFLWFNSIRIFISGASALSENTLNRYTKVFKRAKMLEGYGLSECSPAVCVNTLNFQKAYSVGRPLPGYEVKIVDHEMLEVPFGEVGEIIVHGDCVMQGYLNNPEATYDTIINGWLRTGDLGKMDEDGFIYIVDRIKDLIISKGINIYPRQIEEELMHLPYVNLCAVIAKPDVHSGEIPIAFIVLEDGIDKTQITQTKVKHDLKDRLANFKIPRLFYFVDDLPKTATGKVLKRVLKERLREQGKI